jgi:hypothetical protein
MEDAAEDAGGRRREGVGGGFFSEESCERKTAEALAERGEKGAAGEERARSTEY